MLTPSQKARRYADENGFKIVANGKRYTVTRGDVTFTRSGYDAVLNEMIAITNCIYVPNIAAVKRPWMLVFKDDRYGVPFPTRHASYADAVKHLRRIFTTYGKNKPVAHIVWSV